MPPKSADTATRRGDHWVMIERRNRDYAPSAE
jgi:hypothetical protein